MQSKQPLIKKVNVDAALITEIKNGDKEAFSLLVQKYQARINKLVNRYINDPSESLDITQESFIKAYNALDKFRGDSTFYTWLYRIAINTAKNHIVNKSRRFLETNVESADTEENMVKAALQEFSPPDKIVLNDEIEHVIQETIDHLPEELRIAITLREVDGLTYDEIASKMACPVGTIRSRIYRAREVIERRLKPLLGENT